MSIEKIIESLLDQAKDKDILANCDKESIFAEDARNLRRAANILKSLRSIGAYDVLKNVDDESDCDYQIDGFYCGICQKFHWRMIKDKKERE